MTLRTATLTRRSLLVGAATGVLAGCASGVRDSAPTGRLVTLDGATAALALLLGRPQVGTASFMAADPLLPAIMQIQATPVTDVSGAGGGIEVERLAALRPDLVVGFRSSGADPVLGELATLRTVERTGNSDADCHALAAGMGVEARHLLDDVHRRTAELGARLRGGRTPTISILSPGLDGASAGARCRRRPAADWPHRRPRLPTRPAALAAARSRAGRAGHRGGRDALGDDVVRAGDAVGARRPR